MKTVLTDDVGRLCRKPRRRDYLTDIEFMHALHAHNDAVADAANKAFVAAFRKAMKR